MQTVIETLEGMNRVHLQAAEDKHRTAAESGWHSLIAADFARAASILRSYPGAVKDEAEPAEPEPTIYVSLDEDGEASWDTGRHEGDEIAPDYVAVAARKLIPYGARTPDDEAGRAAVSELVAALARWKAEKEGKLDEPIAPVFTPPEMEDDPRYLKLLVLGLQSRLGERDDVIQVEQYAAATFNALFPKP